MANVDPRNIDVSAVENFNPNSRNYVGEGTKELDRFSVEKQVVLCRPDNAPLDQLIRKLGGGVSTNSQRFEFYSATMNKGIYTVSDASGFVITANGDGTMHIAEASKDLLADHVLICADTANRLGLYHDGREIAGGAAPLVLRVKEKKSDTEYVVEAVNGGSTNITVAKDTVFFKAGNAKNELDVISDVFNLMPVKEINYCQRFMNTVAESDYQAMIEKEADWGIAQYRNASMYDFRTNIELAMFTGQRRRLVTERGEIYFTGGLDDFLKNNIIERIEADTSLSMENIHRWGKEVFSNSNGSAERYMFVSPTFMQEILKIALAAPSNSGLQSIMQVTDATDLRGEKLGFTVRKLDTGYGIINLVMHKGFTGRRDNRAYIVDIANIRRRTLEPISARTVDLEEKLIKKATAIILNECSGLEIQNVDTMGIVDINC